MADEAEKDGRKARGAWSEALGAEFLALLRETGNASGSARQLGHPNLFHNRRRRHPEFARDWAEALAVADARLSPATSPFPRIGKALREARIAQLPKMAADPAILLRPAAKRVPARREHVIRRTRGGRTQIGLAQEGHMTSELEAEFLARLRATGNFTASARAIGFQPTSLFTRMRCWPAFARDCDEALQEAAVQLDYRLIAYAHKLLREPEAPPFAEGEEAEPFEAVPFDPVTAMRIIGFIEARRGGRTGRGRRKGPPERSFDEAVDSVLAKIEAIERHEAMMKAREEGGREGA